MNRYTSNAYNPGQLSKNQLKELFTVRKEIYDDIIIDFTKFDVESTQQHILLEGQRGMGKTTLLLRLAHEISDNEKLNTVLLPVIFSEEQYGIRNLETFWTHVGKYLENTNPLFNNFSQTTGHEIRIAA